MASALVQIRVDDKLKSEVSAIYDRLGLDLSTAVRIFFKRTVVEQGIPFSMRLDFDSKRDCAGKKNPARCHARDDGNVRQRRRKRRFRVDP